MTTKALLLGAIGVLAETSDIQRRAFNTAFEEHELFWHWDEETYRALLEVPGGKARIRYYAMGQGVTVDIDSLYEAKLQAFLRGLQGGVPLRPGVAELIAEAQAQDMKIGFATATEPRQVQAILDALEGELDPKVFDFIGDVTMAANGKPAPDIYEVALEKLGVSADDALAIEDTPESAAAAVAAGIRTFAYPGAEAQGRDFGASVEVIERPGASLLQNAKEAA